MSANSTGERDGKTGAYPLDSLASAMPASEDSPHTSPAEPFAVRPQVLGPVWRSCALVAAIGFLAGCQRLPDCIPKATKPLGGKLAGPVGTAKPSPAQELLIGIDGSGSMLGHTRTANPKQWETMLQAIKTTANSSSGLSVRTFRIGGGSAQELPNNSASAAKDPCFFQGCGSFASVPSSLQTLWQVPGKAKTMPLRLLVSDLEVNDDDISSMIDAVHVDIQRGASVGILAMRLPFTGDVFNAKARTIFSGSLNRPVYLLATGEASQVNTLLNSIREKMSLSGVSAQELSLIDAQSTPKTLLASHVVFEPPGSPQSYSPGSLRLQGRQYTQGKNPDYAFAQIAPTTKTVLLASINPWLGGTKPKDFMLTRLERIALNPGDTTNHGDIQITNLSFSGSNVRMEVAIPKDADPGAIRAMIPAGSLPEPWWITWNRDSSDAADAKVKTDGLLPLMIALSQQVRAAPNAAPAAAFCLAFDFARPKSSP